MNTNNKRIFKLKEKKISDKLCKNTTLEVIIWIMKIRIKIQKN